MDNLVSFLLVNVVLAIILGILTNLATPWIKAVYERSVFSSRKKRLNAMVDDYGLVKKYKENPVELGHYALVNFAYGLSNLVVLIIVVGVDVLIVLNSVNTGKRTDLLLSAIFVTLLWGFNAYGPFKRVYQTMLDIRLFDEYKAQTVVKLMKLGGDPEDLDKEEETNKPVKKALKRSPSK
jgi:hypothetical protein